VLGLLRMLVRLALELVVCSPANRTLLAKQPRLAFLLRAVLPQCGDVIVQMDTLEMMCASLLAPHFPPRSRALTALL